MFSAVRHLAREIYGQRWQILIAFKRDFALASRLSGLGAAWNYILPLVPLTVYMALMSIRVFPAFDGVPSLVYLSIGVTLWLFFAGIVLRPIQVLETKFRELSRTQMPIIAAVLSSFAELLFETTLRLVLVVALFAYLQGWPSLHVIVTPGILLFAVMFFFPVGLILALANLAYRDVGKVTRIAMQYGLFLSGVLFPVHKLPVIGDLAHFNPFYVFIETTRSLAVSGDLQLWPSLLGFGVFGLVLSLIAIRAFYVLELRLRGLA